MALINQILIHQAKDHKQFILLPEIFDSRIRRSIKKLLYHDICYPALFGTPDMPFYKRWFPETRKSKKAKWLSIPADYHQTFAFLGAVKIPNFDLSDYSSLYQAAAYTLSKGLADGVVMGSMAPTALVIRSAITHIEKITHVEKITSAFLLIHKNKILCFCDCAVQPNPDIYSLFINSQLAAQIYQNTTSYKARIALLSFSTHGSARSSVADKMKKVAQLLQKLTPYSADGEIQFDAAYCQQVAQKKISPKNIMPANVFIFPDLQSANIGYKIAQYMGDSKAYGPLLLGLKKPLFDLSRGCSTDDIFYTTCICCSYNHKDYNIVPYSDNV